MGDRRPLKSASIFFNPTVVYLSTQKSILQRNNLRDHLYIRLPRTYYVKVIQYQTASIVTESSKFVSLLLFLLLFILLHYSLLLLLSSFLSLHAWLYLFPYTVLHSSTQCYRVEDCYSFLARYCSLQYFGPRNGLSELTNFDVTPERTNIIHQQLKNSL